MKFLNWTQAVMDILIKTETEKKSNFQVHYEANWPFE